MPRPLGTRGWPGLALPVAGELIIFFARVYWTYAGTCSGSSHVTKSRDFGPGVGRDLLKRWPGLVAVFHPLEQGPGQVGAIALPCFYLAFG